ncbi:unnamed protein product, partial [Staurois parvus]
MVRQARGSTGDGQQRSGSSRVSNEPGQQRSRNTGYQVQGLMGKHTPRPR